MNRIFPAITFLLPALVLLLVAEPLPAAEKSLPVLLSRAIESARGGDLDSSRKHLKTFLTTKPAPGLRARVRLAQLVLRLQEADADIDAALKLCLSLEKDAELAGSFELLYSRGLAYQRLAARELIEHASGEAELRPLVAPGATWKYFKGAVAVPQGWKEPGFDASDWLEGKAGFGYGDEDDATELSDMQGKYPSLFLRYEFALGPGSYQGADSLLLRVRFDDGFIACLNGKELVRVNVPGRRGEPVAHDVTASGQNEADKWEDYIVGSEGLRRGLNTLTIQAHNYTLPSSDFSIEASLASASRPGKLAVKAMRMLDKARADLAAAGKAAGPGVLRRQVATELATVRMLAGDLAGAEAELTAMESVSGRDLKSRHIYLRAWIAFRKGRLLEAGRLLARLAPFSLARSGPGALYLMGRIHHALGEKREAEAFYRLVFVSGAPASEHTAAARLALGAVLIELGDNAEAEKILEEPRGVGPATNRQLFGRLLYGVSLFGSGKLSTARNAFQVVARGALDKELRSRALLWAGRCSVQRWEKGGSWLRKSLSKATVDYLDRGLFLEPEAGLRRSIAIELGEALLRFEKPDEAEKAWRRLRSTGGDTTMAAAYGLLVSLQGQGNYSQAGKLARELLKLYPASANQGALFTRLGDSLLLDGLSRQDADLRLERFSAAVEAYENALGSPGLVSRLTIRFRRGVAILLLGEFRQARAIMAKVAKSAAQATDAEVRSQTAFAAGLLGQLYLFEGERVAGDAFSVAAAVENLEKAGKYLEEFRLNADASSQLRARAELAHGYSLRLRAGLLADPTEKKKLLAQAQRLLSITARRMEHKPVAIRASLELARAQALSAQGTRAVTQLEAFSSRSPWKDSSIAAEALIELARQQTRLRRLPQAFVSLEAAGARALPSLLPLVEFEKALLKTRQGDVGAARLTLVSLYEGPYGAKARGLAALELLRLESSHQVGDRARKLLREVPNLLDLAREELDAELRADLLLELVRLEAAGRRLLSAAAKPSSLGSLRSMLSRDDRRAVTSMVYEAGSLLEAGRVQRALALAEDAYSFSREEGVENEALLARGVCLLVAGKTPQALKAFDELMASTIAGKNEPLRLRLALCLAVTHTRMGDPVKAKESFQLAKGYRGSRLQARGSAHGAAFRETLARLQALSLKPDDNAPDTAMQLTRLFFYRPLPPNERPATLLSVNRSEALRANFLAEARLLELKPLPYQPLEDRALGGDTDWSSLTPLPRAPAGGGTPGAALGQLLREALTGSSPTGGEEGR